MDPETEIIDPDEEFLENLSDNEWDAIELVLSKGFYEGLYYKDATEDEENIAQVVDGIIQRSPGLTNSITIYSRIKDGQDLKNGGELGNPSYLVGPADQTKLPGSAEPGDVTLAISVPAGTKALKLDDLYVLARNTTVVFEPTKSDLIQATIQSGSMVASAKPAVMIRYQSAANAEPCPGYNFEHRCWGKPCQRNVETFNTEIATEGVQEFHPGHPDQAVHGGNRGRGYSKAKETVPTSAPAKSSAAPRQKKKGLSPRAKKNLYKAVVYGLDAAIVGAYIYYGFGFNKKKVPGGTGGALPDSYLPGKGRRGKPSVADIAQRNKLNQAAKNARWRELNDTLKNREQSQKNATELWKLFNP